MSERRTRVAAFVAVAAASMGLATAAWGLPWDTDLADSAFVKAYEEPMPQLPAGVVAQPSMTSPKVWTSNLHRGSPEGEALVNPYGNEGQLLEVGGRMYQIHCSACHGKDGVVLGPVAAPGRLNGVVPLGGPAGVAKNRSDGWIYLTIRNGGAVMPPYGYAMSDTEIWATVAYVRTLDNARFIPQEAP